MEDDDNDNDSQTGTFGNGPGSRCTMMSMISYETDDMAFIPLVSD